MRSSGYTTSQMVPFEYHVLDGVEVRRMLPQVGRDVAAPASVRSIGT
jgi:hypothetical protein